MYKVEKISALPIIRKEMTRTYPQHRIPSTLRCVVSIRRTVDVKVIKIIFHSQKKSVKLAI